MLSRLILEHLMIIVVVLMFKSPLVHIMITMLLYASMVFLFCETRLVLNSCLLTNLFDELLLVCNLFARLFSLRFPLLSQIELMFGWLGLIEGHPSVWNGESLVSPAELGGFQLVAAEHVGLVLSIPIVLFFSAATMLVHV